MSGVQAASGSDGSGAQTELPSVSIVLLVYNRRDELRITLEKMLTEVDYDQSRINVIVVDNASEDGSSEMVRSEFPQVRLIRRDVNNGVAGFNDGFAVAEGDWILALDDDCYLDGDGLRRAVDGALEHSADLVSFGVSTPAISDYRFDHRYRTGLLTFWGCAALIRREALRELGGYDPEIFVWANELEFTIRFYDLGYRHLHMPEVIAMHMKEVSTDDWRDMFAANAYFINQRHFAYIAAKLLRPRDAFEAFVALSTAILRMGLRTDRRALRALRPSIEGFANGLRHRDPIKSAEVSRSYRHNFHSFMSPWWISRPAREALAAPLRWFVARLRGHRPEPPPGRRDDYFAQRSAYYPEQSATLDF